MLWWRKISAHILFDIFWVRAAKKKGFDSISMGHFAAVHRCACMRTTCQEAGSRRHYYYTVWVFYLALVFSSHIGLT